MTVRGVVLDMDGVLWRGDEPLPGLTELFATLARLELPFVLATNNATKTVPQYVQKLARFGVRVQLEQVLTSPGAAVSYLQEHFPAGTSVYVVGEAALRETLAEAGFRVVGADEVRAGNLRVGTLRDGTMCADEMVVVGGLATTSLSYELLAGAVLLVRAGAAFVATNYDLTYPSELGQLPGAGAVLSVVSAASGVDPTIVGKPYPAMFGAAAQRLGTRADETLMVGDRLETDVAGAKAAGFKAALILTGVARTEDVSSAAQGAAPDYVVDDLAALGELLQSLPR